MEKKEVGWPFIVAFGLIVATFGVVQFATDNILVKMAVSYCAIIFFNLTALFVKFIFDEELKDMPLYKKFIVAYFPLLLVSHKFRDWIMQ